MSLGSTVPVKGDIEVYTLSDFYLKRNDKSNKKCHPLWHQFIGKRAGRHVEGRKFKPM